MIFPYKLGYHSWKFGAISMNVGYIFEGIWFTRGEIRCNWFSIRTQLFVPKYLFFSKSLRFSIHLVDYIQSRLLLNTATHFMPTAVSQLSYIQFSWFFSAISAYYILHHIQKNELNWLEDSLGNAMGVKWAAASNRRPDCILIFWLVLSQRSTEAHHNALNRLSRKS